MRDWLGNGAKLNCHKRASRPLCGGCNVVGNARMYELASTGQLRQGFIRWALLCIPLGVLSGALLKSAAVRVWFDEGVQLALPEALAFFGYWEVFWFFSHLLLGVAIALVAAARGASLRKYGLFAVGALCVAGFACISFISEDQSRSLVLVLSAVFGVLAVATLWLLSHTRFWAALFLLPYLLCASILVFYGNSASSENIDAANTGHSVMRIPLR